MRKAQGAAAINQPLLVTPTEVRRFDKAVTVRDRGAFLFERDRLVREKVAAATNVAAEATPLTETLRRKAASLRAATSWAPTAADVQRIPDWQLEAPGLQLARTVLQAAEDVDAWTVYRALAEPCEALGGQSPSARANRGNVDAVARVVLASLGVQPADHGRADA